MVLPLRSCAAWRGSKMRAGLVTGVCGTKRWRMCFTVSTFM
jgi:hypothetical protein